MEPLFVFCFFPVGGGNSMAGSPVVYGEHWASDELFFPQRPNETSVRSKRPSNIPQLSQKGDAPVLHLILKAQNQGKQGNQLILMLRLNPREDTFWGDQKTFGV